MLDVPPMMIMTILTIFGHFIFKHMGRECVFSEKKSSITSVKLFGMGKVSGITKKNFKIGTLEDFEKTYVLYVAMAKKPLSSGKNVFPM